MRFKRLQGLLIAALFVASPWVQAQQAVNSPVTVYKTPTCSCCSAWVEYLEDEGFAVTTHDLTNLTEIKIKHGLTDPKLASCHTAIVDGYVVEGHVPANDIRRLLRERPPLVGITAPGMPQQSPGMFSRDPKNYDVLGFDADGKVSVYSRY